VGPVAPEVVAPEEDDPAEVPAAGDAAADDVAESDEEVQALSTARDATVATTTPARRARS